MLLRLLSVAAPAAVVLALGSSASAAEKSATHKVAISGMVYVPATLEAKVGDEVVWTNDDVVPHTVTGQGFDSGAIAPGKSWKMKLSTKGSVPYKCTYHPSMLGTLSVKAP